MERKCEVLNFLKPKQSFIRWATEFLHNKQSSQHVQLTVYLT